IQFVGGEGEDVTTGREISVDRTSAKVARIFPPNDRYAPIRFGVRQLLVASRYDELQVSVAAELKYAGATHVEFALNKRDTKFVGTSQRQEGCVEGCRALALAEIEDREVWMPWRPCRNESDFLGKSRKFRRCQ